MKYFALILTLYLYALQGQAQGPITLEMGKVSFVSSQNIYVKFPSTEAIKIGDTLLVKRNDQLIAVASVTNKSSVSVVCKSISEQPVKVGDELFIKIIIVVEEEPEVELIEEKEVLDPETNNSNQSTTKEEEPEFKQKIKGRVSASSYSSFSDYKNVHRMRYAFTFTGSHLKNSKFSVDSYLTFRHTIGEWDEVKGNVAKALKVYSLSVKYDFNKSSHILLGRKINPRMSSLGANDGLQFEKRFKNVFLGAVGGTRPDYQDYLYNYKLPQFGAYVGYQSSGTQKRHQSIIGYVEQWNTSNVDRRFIYIQHRNDFIKNLSFMSSFEIDLYEKINGEKSTTFRPVNMYVSLRARVTSKVRLFASYDNRDNVIYYESYKSYIDQLIDNEARQGFRLGMTYRANKLITWGVNSSLRFQKSKENISRNFNTYLSFSQIPGVKMRVTVRGNYLQNNYLNNQTASIRLSKDLFKGKVGLDAYYRWVNYKYSTSERKVNQNVAGFSTYFRIMKNLSAYIYYEGTFDKSNNTYHRFNTKIIQRF